MNLIYSCLITVMISLSSFFWHPDLVNETPIVQIISPSKEISLNGSKQFQYKIQVTDKEDGQSQYDEIPDNEVYLKIKNLGKSGKMESFAQKEDANDKVFRSMKMNSCFNCHSFQQKLSAPSFREIFDRYGYSNETIQKLSSKIIKGSKGSWSDSQQMPAHPELNLSEASSIAKLILEYGADKDLELYTGLEGLIKVNVHNSKGKYLFIASYLDHGINGEDRKEGKLIKAIVLQ